jgi:peptidyl-prolyl cis-trans isomerase C
LACSPKGPPKERESRPPSNVVATIDDHPITVADLERYIANQPPQMRVQYQSPARKKELLQTLVRFELMVRAAERRGLDKDPEVQRLMKQQMVNHLVQRQVDQGQKPGDISEVEAKAYYDEHADQFAGGLEEARVSEVVIKERGRAEAVIAAAKALAPKDEKGFRTLVKQHSDDPESRAKGGELPWLRRGSSDQPPALVTAALALTELNTVSAAIETPKGFHVLKLWEKRRVGARPFDAVKDEVRSRMYYERRAKRMEDWLSDLRKLSTVKVYEDRLSAVVVAPPARPDAGTLATSKP